MAQSLTEVVKAFGVKGARALGEDDLALDAAAFARIAADLWQIKPLRVLRLWKATGVDLEQALARPELRDVKELFLFRNRLTGADLDAVVTCEQFSTLRLLDFKWCGLSGKACETIAGAHPSRFPALRWCRSSAIAWAPRACKPWRLRP